LRSESESPADCSASARAGFDGNTVLEVILCISSSKFASKVADLIIEWMKVKAKRTVKINGQQFTGYTASEIVTILASSRRSIGHRDET
jgi:hypothetical protein